jgi:hypothetical protein
LLLPGVHLAGGRGAALDSLLVDYARSVLTGTITDPQGNSTVAEVHVVEFGRAERRRRAWLGLAGWWGGAAMATVVPGARLLLVPGLAALGIYSAARRLHTARVVVEVSGICPTCGAAEALEVPETWQPPAPIACRQCGSHLAFAAEEDAGARE